MSDLVNIRGIERLARHAAGCVQLQPLMLADPIVKDELLSKINELAAELFGRYCYRVISSQCYGMDTDAGLVPITGGTRTEFRGSYHGTDFVDTEYESVFGSVVSSTVPAAIFDTLDVQRYEPASARGYRQVAVPLVGQTVDIEPLPRSER
jgi:hypothetical protein